MYSIYALYDQCTHEYCYIGITDDVFGRFLQHIRGHSNNEALHLHLQSLIEEGFMPQMHTLQRVKTQEEAHIRECYWIHHYLDMGYTLYNEHIPSPLHLRDKATQRRIQERIRRSS